MKKLLFSFLLMFAMGSTAHAVPITPTLGDILGNPIYAGEIDTEDEVFRLTDTTGVLDDATAFLFLEYAGFANVNTFGIYGVSDMLEVFNGASSPITSATLSWNVATNDVINLATGDTANINDQAFGFYLESGDGNTYYSQSALNAGIDMMGSFEVGSDGYPGLLGSNMVLAFEDIPGTDYDYNDLVVGVSDVSPSGEPIQQVQIPEPMPLALMGIGLLGLGFMKRKK